MSTNGYSEGYYTQHPPNSSTKDKFGRDIDGGEGQGHANPAKYQYNPLILPFGVYGFQNGAGPSGEQRPVGLWGRADDLGLYHAVGDLSSTNTDFEWGLQQQDPTTSGAGSGVLAALGAGSMNRAAKNSTPPAHQGYIDPKVLQAGYHNLGYPSRQGEPPLPAGAPLLVPQQGTTNADYYSGYGDQDAAAMPSRNMLHKAHFDSYGALPLEIAEGAGSGGAGTFTSIGCASDLNKSELGPWTTPTLVPGLYGGQQGFTDYTQGEQSSQSPYDPRTLEYVEQDGVHVAPNLAHGSTSWTTQQQYGQPAPVTMPADSSISWQAPGPSGYPIPFRPGQAYPSTHGGPSHPETQAGGAYMHPGVPTAMSMGAALSWPPLSNGTSVTLTWPPYYHASSATVLSGTGNSTAAPPAGTANPTEFSGPQRSKMSITRTGRTALRRCVPGRPFEQGLKRVQKRLMREGADVGAVKRLRSEIFPDGNITNAALKADMTLDQRTTVDGTLREGKQRYMMLLEVVPRPDSSQKESDHRCLLCPPWARAEFKNREDSLRHFHKDHFGLSFDCGHCGHKFWLQKELAKHERAKHGQS